MTELEANRNIRLYRIHVLFNESLFLGVILVTLLMGLGQMTVSGIFYMEAVMLSLAFFLEIPTGALSDLIGRKRVLVVARVFHGAGTVLLTFMTNPLDVVVSYLLWTVGGALQSGADTSLLYETLKERGRENEFSRIMGNARSWRLMVKACCALAAGVLASIDLRLPLLIGMPLALIPLFCSFFYVEPARAEKSSTMRKFEIMREGLRAARNIRQVRWIIAFGAAISLSPTVWYWHNPYYELAGIPLWIFGIIGFGSNFAAALGSRYAFMMENMLGEKRSALFIVLAQGLPITAMSLLATPWMATFVVVKSFGNGFAHPFTQTYLNRHIPNAVRNTVLSVQSAIDAFVGVIALATFGFLTDIIGFLNTVTVLGLAVLALGLLSYRVYAVRIQNR